MFWMCHKTRHRRIFYAYIGIANTDTYNRKFPDKSKKLLCIWVFLCACVSIAVFTQKHTRTHTLTEYINVYALGERLYERQHKPLARQYSYGWFDVYMLTFLRVSLEICCWLFSSLVPPSTCVCVLVLCLYEKFCCFEKLFLFFFFTLICWVAKISNGTRLEWESTSFSILNCRQLVFFSDDIKHCDLNASPKVSECMIHKNTHSCHFCCSFSMVVFFRALFEPYRYDIDIDTDSQYHNVYWLHFNTFMLLYTICSICLKMKI